MDVVLLSSRYLRTDFPGIGYVPGVCSFAVDLQYSHEVLKQKTPAVESSPIVARSFLDVAFGHEACALDMRSEFRMQGFVPPPIGVYLTPPK
jgi:hypothetical protein